MVGRDRTSRSGIVEMRLRGFLFLIAGLAVIQPWPAAANVFTHIVREAGEAGGKAAGHGLSHLGPVGKAAAHLKILPNAPKGALAAHATPEGHWQFVNREGQVYTAGTPDELQRVMQTLAPDAVAAGESRLTLYVSEDSFFGNRAALSELPADSQLHMVSNGGAYPVTRVGSAASPVFQARLKPNLIVELADRDLFDETLAYLGRSLNRANIRTIAVEPGGKKYVPSAPANDAVTKLPQVDLLDPSNIAAAFGSIRGQTVLLTGRTSSGKITFSPANGPEITLDVTDLVQAARSNDVNIVILHSQASRQPGGRNWFWQTIEVGGMADATKAATFGDFLDALAQRRGGFQVSAAHEGQGRIQLSAISNATDAGLTSSASSFIEEAVGHVTGEIVTSAVEVHARDKQTESEFDARLIPGIPSYVQIPYLVSIVFGVLAWSVSRSWWRRLWPVNTDDLPKGRAERMLRALPREAVFWLIFMPLAGFPALIWQMLSQIWLTVTAPIRWIRRRFLVREV